MGLRYPDLLAFSTGPQEAPAIGRSISLRPAHLRFLVPNNVYQLTGKVKSGLWAMTRTGREENRAGAAA